MTTLMTIENNHSEACGKPPAWIQEDQLRRFYFENWHGEQWVAAIDKERLRVAGGDLGWETLEVALKDVSSCLSGYIELMSPNQGRPKSFLGKVVNQEEAVWIMSVLFVASEVAQALATKTTRAGVETC